MGWSAPTQDRAVCLCEPSTPGWWGPLQGFVCLCIFFTYPKGKRWKEGGKTNSDFLFGSSGTAEGQGTVGEGGASLCLNYYAKNQNKTKQKKAACLIYCGRGALSQTPGFPVELGGRPRLGRCLLQPERGLVRSRSVERPGPCKARGHLTVCFLGASVACGGGGLLLP